MGEVQTIETAKPALSREQALDWLEKMLLIRRFEERAEEAYSQGKIGGFLHLYIGEEPIAVGAMAALQPNDDVVTHYRDHGYPIARGSDLNALMAELYGKATGICKGKGGSMHLADVPRHLWGGYAIVGGHIPLAVGLAMANVYQKRDTVVACFFGDGATNIGMFHEGLNMAGVWKLPALFIVENNRYGMGTAVARASAVTELYQKACAYDMPAVQIDGSDPEVVYQTVGERAARARRGEGPQFIEILTYRFLGHSMGDPQRYRSKEEVEQERQRDPILRFEKKMVESGWATRAEIESLRQRVEERVDESVRFAEESPFPTEAEQCADVYAAYY